MATGAARLGDKLCGISHTHLLLRLTPVGMILYKKNSCYVQKIPAAA
jgi:hypothetical protein